MCRPRLGREEGRGGRGGFVFVALAVHAISASVVLWQRQNKKAIEEESNAKSQLILAAEVDYLHLSKQKKFGSLLSLSPG